MSDTPKTVRDPLVTSTLTRCGDRYDALENEVNNLLDGIAPILSGAQPKEEGSDKTTSDCPVVNKIEAIIARIEALTADVVNVLGRVEV